MKRKFRTAHLIFFVAVASAQSINDLLNEIPPCAVRFVFFPPVIAISFNYYIHAFPSGDQLTTHQRQCVISAAESSPCASDQTITCVCANIQAILPGVNSCARQGCSQADLNSWSPFALYLFISNALFASRSKYSKVA